MGFVWAVCKDPGGTNGLLPVVKQLRNIGHDVKVIPNGKAVELLGGGNEECFTFEQALALMPEPDVLVTSMCSDGGLGRNLVPLLFRAGIPAVALQDFWGARLWTSWADPRYRPNYICVNDEIGADIVIKAWPEILRSRIKITGYPAMDKYANLDVEGTAARARLALGLTEKKPVILYAGSVEREGEVISEVVKVLNEIGADIYFVPRQHPRMKNNAPEEVPHWEKAMDDFKGGTLIADSSACDTISIIAASDLVIAMYSAVNIEAELGE